MTGSSRVVIHTLFAELQWGRDPFSPRFFRLPPGFQARSHLLTEEFIEVLEDIHALQCIREFRSASRNTLSMAYINNHQASIQSRLVGLSNVSSVLKCCYLAAYLCPSMLCCTIWCASVIPVRRSYRFRSSSLLIVLSLRKPYSKRRDTDFPISLRNVLTLDFKGTDCLTITMRPTKSAR